MRAVVRADGDGFVLQLLRFVDAEFRIGHDCKGRHRRAQRHDLRRTVSGRHIGFHRALHHAPLAHAKLVAGALVVERLHGALKHIVSERLMIGPPLRRAGSLQNLHVQPLILEKTFVPRHEQGQIVNGVHHRNADFLDGLRRGAHWLFLFRLGKLVSRILIFALCGKNTGVSIRPLNSATLCKHSPSYDLCAVPRHYAESQFPGVAAGRGDSAATFLMAEATASFTMTSFRPWSVMGPYSRCRVSGFNSLLYSSVISVAICWSALFDSASRSAPLISITRLVYSSVISCS